MTVEEGLSELEQLCTTEVIADRAALCQRFSRPASEYGKNITRWRDRSPRSSAVTKSDCSHQEKPGGKAATI
ncbi:MAG: hypothetical protein WC198_07325 [Victivallaceae bacterium]